MREELKELIKEYKDKKNQAKGKQEQWYFAGALDALERLKKGENPADER